MSQLLLMLLTGKVVGGKPTAVSQLLVTLLTGKDVGVKPIAVSPILLMLLTGKVVGGKPTAMSQLLLMLLTGEVVGGKPASSCLIRCSMPPCTTLMQSLPNSRQGPVPHARFCCLWLGNKVDR